VECCGVIRTWKLHKFKLKFQSISYADVSKTLDLLGFFTSGATGQFSVHLMELNDEHTESM
jgi:hypothetical protein